MHTHTRTHTSKNTYIQVAEQQKGPEARMRELAELTQIYVDRGLSRDIAYQVIHWHITSNYKRKC